MVTRNAPARRPIKDDGHVGVGTPIWDAEFADRWRALHEEQPEQPQPAPRREPRRPMKKTR